MMSFRHIIWDWNGTLLDDTAASVNALNLMLKRRGRDPITLDCFRDHFSFPARRFYEEIGMAVSDAEWDALAREYLDLYALQPQGLHPETEAVLKGLADRGVRQYILSASRQDLLEDSVRHYGLLGYFDGLYGTGNIDGASKMDRAQELVAHIKSVDPSAYPDAILQVGDALHDRDVANVLGVPCRLFTRGSHAGWRLAKVAPTFDSLLGLLELVPRRAI